MHARHFIVSPQCLLENHDDTVALSTRRINRMLLLQNFDDKICIWHCFLVDKGSDRYASPDTGQAEGECLYRR